MALMGTSLTTAFFNAALSAESAGNSSFTHPVKKSANAQTIKKNVLIFIAYLLLL